MNKVTITDPFWLRYEELIRTQMLPYQWRVLNDEEDIVIAKERDASYIPSEKSHCVENFRIAAGQKRGHHYGMVFQDSDLYKWLEAVAYTLQHHEDPKLQALADEAIELIAAAQEPDGYLNTYFTIEAPERKFKRLYQSHELYCAGHFIEAAVAYHEATGNDTVLTCACRLADCLNHHFGPEEGQIHGYDGHPEIELALFRLYEITQEDRYRKLGRFFLYERGKDPDFFQKQCEADDDKSLLIEGMESFKPSYYQNHAPILKQMTAEGHAVRMTYLCTGISMLARLENDNAMLAAAQRLWKNITQKRMYITGGIGSTVTGEAFTADYDLPNDTMYCETCASVGLIFFAHQLLQCAPRGEYADIMERALYNTVLASVALDGKHFFYVNPLEVVPLYDHSDPGKSHVKTTRPAWFGCACCPPNMARLLSSLDRYAYTVHDNTVYVCLYLNNHASLMVDDHPVILQQETQYPWQGTIKITLQSKGDFHLALRLPQWTDTFTVHVNNKHADVDVHDGFLFLHRSWEIGDTIALSLPMQAAFYIAAPEVRDDIHRLAVQRGPLVYCAESIDNGKELEKIRLDSQEHFQYHYDAKQFGGVGLLDIPAERLTSPATGQALYHKIESEKLHPVTLHFIPYYCWGNRGENEMSVWLPQK